jgi:hypothetical protein
MALFGSNKVKLFSLGGSDVTATIDLPIGAHNLHGNSMTFYGTPMTQDSVLPPLYVSQWDGDKGVLVFDIQQSGGVYSAVLAQVITIDVDSNAIGAGPRDFVPADGELLCVSYLLSSAQTIEGNETIVTRLPLPPIAESAPTLAGTDVLDSFRVEGFIYRQDMAYNAGKLYVANGNSGIERCIRVIDVRKRCMVSKIDIADVNDAEPEGIVVHDDVLMLAYNGTARLFMLGFE